LGEGRSLDQKHPTPISSRSGLKLIEVYVETMKLWSLVDQDWSKYLLMRRREMRERERERERERREKREERKRRKSGGSKQQQ
jgi:hypothetical protein